ncbi:MAG: glycosyl hydrolase, partial [Oscillospiraceae bacterium]
MKFDEKLFRNPTAKYRGAPFWAWNCALTPELLKSQIGTFKKMGFGGFYMHSRTGLASEFMGDEYLKAVEFCVKTAKEESMLAYLYDEDRWPSGVGGGFVTENPEFRSRYLCFTPFAYGEGKSFDVEFTAQATAGRNEKGRLLSCYDVVLDDCGFISHYERIPETKAPRGTKWYAYLETEQPSDWYNGNTYVDTLNKKAIEQFLAVVHEKYKALLGDEFGKTIPNIFTDEPQFSHKTILSNPFSKEDVILPWTDDFADTYKRAYGDDILDFLPEIFWEKQDGISAARYRFHDHSTERFVSAFIDTVGEWCRESGIKLVGHMMEEPTLQSQTSALGEAMRTYRSFGVVGIDMLCNSYEYNTVKQAQSVAHQRGLSGIMCEMYGVTGWDFDFRGHKSQGDWQAALGVTHRVPHLAWMSMSGEAKRDYPASIGYQSPWYEKYNVIEDYFARLGTVLDSGNPVVRIAVIHPIESYWLMWGPDSQTSPQREEMEERFGELTKWLLFSGMDFDFICESILPELCTDIGNPLKVGVMSYDAIIVPPLKNIRKTTADILKTFASKGGKLIFLEKEPGYINLEARTLEFT